MARESTALANLDDKTAPHARILIVEDDAEVRHLVERCLEERGYKIWCAASAADALMLMDKYDLDLAIVDLMLPDANGIMLVRRFSKDRKIPVLVLSGLGAPHQRVAGLDAGADDYVSKPFEPGELVARVAAALRARDRALFHRATTNRKLRVDDWLFDLLRQTAIDPSGQVIELTTAEFRLLEALLNRPNRVLSREEILEATHESGDATPRSVDIQVTRLRKKLEGSRGPRLILTVRRKGYMLTADCIESVADEAQ